MLPGESHHEFLELCALSTTSLLSAQERRRLEEHLRGCQACREMHAQYRALVDSGIPAAVAQREEEPNGAPGFPWSVDEAEAALFARLDHEEDAGNGRVAGERGSASETEASSFPYLAPLPGPSDEPVDALWRQMWWQYAVAVLLVGALVVYFYRTGIRRGAELATATTPATHLETAARAKTSDQEEGSARERALLTSIREQSDQLSALRAQLQSKSGEVARLAGEKALLDKSLLEAGTDRDQIRESAAQLSQKLASSESDVAAMRQQIAALGGQDAQDQVRLTALEQQIGDLRSSLNGKDQEIAREQELLDHDRDIRELMGSRDLYIAEVYDVAKSGDTQKPFGRVFYTRGKSLIFYAYDLDQQAGIRRASSFQAWGLRGPDQAVNLGILYVDNAAKKRWVLKEDDPRAIEDIDAVFVTVEPHGGSQKPTGKRLLFAYLKVEPNHP